LKYIVSGIRADIKSTKMYVAKKKGKGFSRVDPNPKHFFQRPQDLVRLDIEWDGLVG
jgi:hypothetical protein